MMSPKIYKSPYPSVTSSDATLPSFIFSNPHQTPGDKVSFVDIDTKVTRTFHDVEQMAKSLAEGLRGLGVKDQEVVGFLSPNSINYAMITFGIIGCGAIAAPLSASATATELIPQLQLSGARFVIAHSSRLAIIKDVVRRLPHLKVIQADGEIDEHGEPTALKLAREQPARPFCAIGPRQDSERIAFLCFSSGTTGPSKGVKLSHQNITTNIQQTLQVFGDAWNPSAAIVAFQPFNHIYGMTWLICLSLYNGATTVVMPKYSLATYLEAIQEYRPEYLFAVPPVVLQLAKDETIPSYDLSSVKAIMSAAAPLSNDLRLAVEKRFYNVYKTSVMVFQAWGMTETSPGATVVPPNRRDKAHTVGCIYPNMEFRIVDPETDEDVGLDAEGNGRSGEIWCRGPNVTSGYYKNRDADLQSFSHAETATGWYKTGDIGMFDKDGYLTIVDRIKEMIKYKGLQVIPSELEGYLLSHPDIADAGVVGVWIEEQATELPTAFVIPSQAGRMKSSKDLVHDLHRWWNGRVANHKRLRGGIHIVDDIPKSASGKILRRELKAIGTRMTTARSKL